MDVLELLDLARLVELFEPMWVRAVAFVRSRRGPVAMVGLLVADLRVSARLIEPASTPAGTGSCPST